jgi:hypothetical protein
MPGAQIPTSVTRLESMLGYQAVSLTNFASSALSAIAAGSKVEIAGAFFTFTADEAIEASTWTSIVTGNTAYIALIPAGVAGSQTVTARFTATAPVWSTSKQGWYASAGSSTRVIGSVYKAEATAQYGQQIFDNPQNYGWRGIVERITSGSGNWTVPVGVSRIRVTCVGGGAGGGGGSGSAADGGGGGGTNISLVLGDTLNVYPGQSIAYAVGAGGAGGTGAGGTSGATGGSTTFTGATTGQGGLGGTTYIFGGAGPAGGAGSAGSQNTGGGGGGGAGATGGRGATPPGTAGYAGGGGGGFAGGNGGNGGSGIIIIEY